jgi:hypothetical protein
MGPIAMPSTQIPRCAGVNRDIWGRRYPLREGCKATLRVYAPGQCGSAITDEPLLLHVRDTNSHSNKPAVPAGSRRGRSGHALLASLRESERVGVVERGCCCSPTTQFQPMPLHREVHHIKQLKPHRYKVPQQYPRGRWGGRNDAGATEEGANQGKRLWTPCENGSTTGSAIAPQQES